MESKYKGHISNCNRCGQTKETFWKLCSKCIQSDIINRRGNFQDYLVIEAMDSLDRKLDESKKALEVSKKVLEESKKSLERAKKVIIVLLILIMIGNGLILFLFNVTKN